MVVNIIRNLFSLPLIHQILCQTDTHLQNFQQSAMTSQWLAWPLDWFGMSACYLPCTIPHPHPLARARWTSAPRPAASAAAAAGKKTKDAHQTHRAQIPQTPTTPNRPAGRDATTRTGQGRERTRARPPSQSLDRPSSASTVPKNTTASVP